MSGEQESCRALDAFTRGLAEHRDVGPGRELLWP